MLLRVAWTVMWRKYLRAIWRFPNPAGTLKTSQTLIAASDPLVRPGNQFVLNRK